MSSRLQRILIPFAPILAKHQKLVLSLRFRKALGRSIQNPPLSFYDKVFWMSACTDTQIWSNCADKVKVRDYISERCGDAILCNLYAVYQSAEEIDFDSLPDAFVIKTNNGCGSNYIVRSKAKSDLEEIRNGLKYWLRFPYGQLTGQLHYARIVPQILVEELLYQYNQPDSTLIDYKFYCFNGIPMYCYVVSDRHFDRKHTHSRMIYDTSWSPIPSAFIHGVDTAYIDKPNCLQDMLLISSKLSANLPFVRVDLYQVNGEVKFSEMTFMPGMDPGFTEKFQRELGELIILNNNDTVLEARKAYK